MGISPSDDARPESDNNPQPHGEPALDLALREFTYEFSKMIDMGISLVRSLDVLQRMEKNSTLRAVIGDLGERVESGESLSRAMQSHSDIFDGVYISLVRAGEVGGVLEETLKRLVKTVQVKEESLEGKSLYEDRKEVKEFAWLFGTLLTSGVPILQALETSSARFEDPMKSIILEARELIREGDRLSTVFGRHPEHFDPMFVHALGVGEESGSLDFMMMKYSDSDDLLGH